MGLQIPFIVHGRKYMTELSEEICVNFSPTENHFFPNTIGLLLEKNNITENKIFK